MLGRLDSGQKQALTNVWFEEVHEMGRVLAGVN
jgi:hypothetical protein